MSYRITKAEKLIIAECPSDHQLFKCKEHGIFSQNLRSLRTGNCLHCNNKCAALENASDLKAKYRKELAIV